MNEKIINERWKKTREELKKFSSFYNRLNKSTQDELQTIINSYDIEYEQLYSSISNNEKKRLQRKIEEWKKAGIYTGYFKYYVESLTKGSITYMSLIEILLYGAYEEEKARVNNEIDDFFSVVALDCYNQGRRELNKREVKKCPHILLDTLYTTLVGGITLANYMNALYLTSMQEIKKAYVISTQQGKRLDMYSDTSQELFKKQRNRLICINDDMISGGLDTYTTALGNYSYVKASDEDSKVRFVSDKCENVTEMCSYMDNMLFNTESRNVFKRPMGKTKKDLLIQEIDIMGLVIGINLPPIQEHFHWCHSTVTYQIDKTADELRPMIFDKELENRGLSVNNKSQSKEKHLPPKLLEVIDINDKKVIETTLKKYENKIKDDKIENAIVITSDGEVYQCFGTKDEVFPDKDLGDKLYNAYVTHNHPKDVTNYSFGGEDQAIFSNYNLKVLRGIDYKYIYEFNRNKKPALDIPTDYLYGEYGYEHLKSIQYAIDNDIYYMRWNNE